MSNDGYKHAMCPYCGCLSVGGYNINLSNMERVTVFCQNPKCRKKYYVKYGKNKIESSKERF